MSTTTTRKVTFKHPFQVPGMDVRQLPGTFDVAVETVELDVPWAAHRTSLTLLLPAGAHIEAWPISGEELDRLLAHDLQMTADTGHS